MLDRLAGLETEYAIRFDPDVPSVQRPVDYRLYEAVIAALRNQVLTVSAGELKEGVFLGTGGAVWFERVRFTGGFGLVEGSTPECRGPRELLQYQRGQDELLATACRDADVPGALTLIKNDRDSQGNVYGAQENYEISIGSPRTLLAWRIGLTLLFPFLLLGWVGYGLIWIGIFLYVILAGLGYFFLQFFLPGHWREPVLRVMLGEEFTKKDVSAYACPVPTWLEVVVPNVIRVVTAPFATGLYLLVHWTAGRSVRQRLTPFLITRPLFGGAGLVSDGEFRLSDKADAMNCQLGYNGMIFDRPIFSIGHLFKPVVFSNWSSPREYLRLFEPRQRLQICIGDSNMAEEAEYLRIATTMLVLDALEAGAVPANFRLSRPIHTLRQICGDLEFQKKYRFAGGRPLTAIEIQREYLRVCQDYVDSAVNPPPEAKAVLKRWEEVLDLLLSDQEQLIGRLDWVTKRYLLSQSEPDSDPDVQKKIDIRYHELSTDGYFQQLTTTGLTRSILQTEEIDRATRLPPPNTPATLRSRYIREFSVENVAFQVNWNTVTVGRGPKARVIDLTRD
ncbi:proteasome accessory factor PafA2 family protein [Thalassoroseus pseudoceratinae]|uniref:proteasome accessory factor PafA2 family protein n=1 Tax=Thalassoroseus pseudoceratinae TaxID=2713176 RepID=UPI001423AF25|nr:proteasome accessory factor PafA2 family protein [Thalassoroseus pseudoceratinae]